MLLSSERPRVQRSPPNPSSFSSLFFFFSFRFFFSSLSPLECSLKLSSRGTHEVPPMSPVVHKRVLSDYSPPPLSPPSPLLCFCTSAPQLSLCPCVALLHMPVGMSSFFFFLYNDDPTPHLHQSCRRQAQINRAEPLPRTVEYLRITAFCFFYILYNVLLFIDRSVDRLPLLLFQCWLKWSAHAAASQCFCCFHNVIFGTLPF